MEAKQAERVIDALAIDDAKRGSLVNREMVLAVAEEMGQSNKTSGEEDAAVESSDDDEAKRPNTPVEAAKGEAATQTEAEAESVLNAQGDAKQQKAGAFEHPKTRNTAEDAKKRGSSKKPGKEESSSGSNRAKAVVPVKKGVKEGKTPPKSTAGAKRKAVVKASPTAESEDDDDADHEQTATPTSKKVRTIINTPKAAKAKKRPAPTSYEEADEGDKLLWDLRQEGKSWTEIRDAVNAATGTEYGLKSLPIRYDRIKAIFYAVKNEDERVFLSVKNEVERQFEIEKWAKIAALMKEQHGLNYSVRTLKSSFKKIAANAKGAASVAPSTSAAPVKHKEATPAVSEDESSLSDVDPEAIEGMDLDEDFSAQ
ncbi:MAG: hypothetical protein M1823_005836 [Watsoniomyces obsoletus]|nr:MAG: hypothetical protein M1823_005836 [Watsoniomyces obsoletus]